MPTVKDNLFPSLPFDRKLPTRTEIRIRMQESWGEAGQLLLDVFEHNAEIAEKILWENTYQEIIRKPKTVQVERERVGTNVGKWRITHYECPACVVAEIRLESKFCPNCGVQLEWRNPPVVIGMATKSMKNPTGRVRGFAGFSNSTK